MSDIKATKYVICDQCGEGSWRRPSRCTPPIKCHACASRENGKLTPGNVVHGLKHHKLYPTWSQMQCRCNTPGHPRYKDYGARGITVCDEWATFPAFLEWALANGWEERVGSRKETLSIERIDNDNGYHPDNCEFITVSENSRRAKTAYWERWHAARG